MVSYSHRNHAKVILYKNVKPGDFYLRIGSRNIGEISIGEKLKNPGEYMGKFKLFNKDHAFLIRAGLNIVKLIPEVDLSKKFPNRKYLERVKYAKTITTPVDRREMCFIPGGKFPFGSDFGEKDESPEQMVKLLPYYMDKYEVSNADFKIFADNTGTQYPPYWSNNIINGEFRTEFFAQLPVIVTYKEAWSYAKWAGKRLPTEKEWERGALPGGEISQHRVRELYPWGLSSLKKMSNSRELWMSGENIKELAKVIALKYPKHILKKGYLPVHIFPPKSLSRSGLANMCGNASEWTSSWYLPHEGNGDINRRYGKQYKVIKGGAFFMGIKNSRNTARQIGGIPNLYRDRAAGFRCVKDVSPDDRIDGRDREKEDKKKEVRL